MKLNHLNLAVPDVAATRAFFEQHFGLKCLETKGDNTISILIDEGGFVLNLSSFDKQTRPQYPRDFHIGFIRDSIQQVNELYESLKNAGIEMNSPRSSHGGFGFYLVAPGGIQVEVVTYVTNK